MPKPSVSSIPNDHQSKPQMRPGALRLLLLAAAGCLLFSPLPAQNRRACQEDVKKYCSAVQPGQGRIKACLQGQQDRLSEACRAQLTRWDKVKQACQNDRKQFCGEKRGAELRQCIKANRANFSEACKSAVREARGK